jgi:uncharacterized delta-60 repeat protein
MRTQQRSARQLESLESRTLFAANLVTGGQVDLSFGALTPPVIDVANTDAANDIAVAPDGKVLVLGQHVVVPGGDVFSTVIRLTDAGRMDTTFGVNGIATLPHPQGMSMLITADGHILVGGSTVGTGTPSTQGIADMQLQRLNADGSVDATFGNNGVVTHDIGLREDITMKVLQQGDGKFMAVGYEQREFLARAPQTPHIFLARFEPNGQIDPSFGNNGIVLTDLPQFAVERAASAVLQPDGKIVIAGYSQVREGYYDHGPSPVRVLLLRYNTDGSLDTRFGKKGIAGSKKLSDVADITLTDTGRFLVAGSRAYGPNESPAVIRFKSNGAADTGFGRNGVALASFRALLDTPQDSTFGASVISRSDGAITLAARSSSASVCLARFTARGKLDKNFGNNGISRTDTPPTVSGVHLAVQADGKLLTASGGADITVQRYFADTVRPFAVVAKGVLTVVGTPYADSITIETQPGPVGDVVRVDRGGYVMDFLATDFTSLKVSGGGGDDIINLNDSVFPETLPATIDGGDGNDTITGGTAADRLIGGKGNDSIFAKDGQIDRVDGGRGLDQAQIGSDADLLRSVEEVIP